MLQVVKLLRIVKLDLNFEKLECFICVKVDYGYAFVTS